MDSPNDPARNSKRLGNSHRKTDPCSSVPRRETPHGLTTFELTGNKTAVPRRDPPHGLATHTQSTRQQQHWCATERSLSRSGSHTLQLTAALILQPQQPHPPRHKPLAWPQIPPCQTRYSSSSTCCKDQQLPATTAAAVKPPTNCARLSVSPLPTKLHS